jgi:serine/threonine protein kinase/tetratricopeptide (TPR) repeat protein
MNAIAPQTRIGPFEILEQVGEGGMGVVYKARDTRLDRVVALKVSKSRYDSRFACEARIVASLSHPNICTLFDVGPNYLVMEYIRGVPIKGPSTEKTVLRHALQICDALAVAHERGIIHRDLKPGNILLTHSGIKLLDFGLAKVRVCRRNGAISTQTESGTILGTPSYMSPEQAQGQTVDVRSDIFSLGSLLYELLTGRRAFSGPNAMATLVSVLRDEPTPIDGHSRLKNIIARCLRKHPADRYQSVVDLRAALEDIDSTDAPPEPIVPSLAVLPFISLGNENESEYFCDKLREEISNVLTRLPGLRVVSRMSAVQFDGRDTEVAEIGRRLNVSNILTGSVQIFNSRILVSVQLIEVGTQSHLWSQRYERDVCDIFDGQHETAQAIVEQLKVRLRTRSARTLIGRNREYSEAHRLYLRGTLHYSRCTPAEINKGQDLLEQAVELDPLHSAAWFRLADSYIGCAHFGGSPPLSEWSKARRAAAKALEADPESAEARAAVGFVTAVAEFRWEEGLQYLDSTLDLNPECAQALFWRADVLHCMGRTEDAYLDVCKAVRLDPLSALFRRYCAYYCLLMGQPARAVEHVQELIEIDPHYSVGAYLLGEAYSLLGRHEDGIAQLEKEARDGPGPFLPLGFLGWAYVRGGRIEDARQFLKRLQDAAHTRYIPPATIALAAMALDDEKTVLSSMEQALEERDPNLSFGIRTRYFRTLRSNARYQSLLKRMHLDIPT